MAAGHWHLISSGGREHCIYKSSAHWPSFLAKGSRRSGEWFKHHSSLGGVCMFILVEDTLKNRKIKDQVERLSQAYYSYGLIYTFLDWFHLIHILISGLITNIYLLILLFTYVLISVFFAYLFMVYVYTVHSLACWNDRNYANSSNTREEGVSGVWLLAYYAARPDSSQHPWQIGVCCPSNEALNYKIE